VCLYETAYGVRSTHEILRTPIKITPPDGPMAVLKKRGTEQKDMGAAFTTDSIVNSIDAELIALGDSAKGPDRGSIIRHGPYTIWAYHGEADDMTEIGKALFVNTCFYATRHANSRVLERRLNRTRDARHSHSADRPYIRVKRTNRRAFEVDALARKLGVANHKKAYLRRLIHMLPDAEALAALEYYTGITTFGEKPSRWKQWYDGNQDYLWFSDCEGFRWKIDEEARKRGIPTAKLRGWSSEEIDYRR